MLLSNRKSGLPVESVNISANVTEHAKDNCNIKSIFRITWRAIFELQSLPRIPKLNKWIIILGCENKKHKNVMRDLRAISNILQPKISNSNIWTSSAKMSLYAILWRLEIIIIHFNAYTRTYMSHYWDANFAAYLVAPCWYA